MKLCAIIAAGGRGLRMKSAVNKQFIEIEKKPIIAHTLEIFERNAHVDYIIPVVPEDWLLYFAENVVDTYSFAKINKIVIGGQSRQESVFAGLKSLEAEITHIVIHDAVRPFLDQSSLNEIVATGERTGAAILAMPVSDTLKQVQNGIVEKTLDRSAIWRVQTPQMFERMVIVRAYQKAFEDGVWATDDASLVERLGYKVHIVEGRASNIKITTPDDLLLATYILTAKTYVI
ncbi:MAG: 2-C-methyl-D-erythritol 4-phosphate cytidylyltransferase [Candidatus Zhuqueibacterota bacterium]